MKIIIFAGGSGKRFWPISRVNTPKQFIPIANHASTLELAVKRVQPVFGLHNIFISTNEQYIGKVKELIPEISSANIFGEPMRKDVGPAAGLALMRLRKMGVHEPIAILWADHFMEDVEEFQDKLKLGEKLVLW
jgi:mannose-1-phosphate guanylyltransferase